MMQAVILAAGRGRRLKEGIPKCLLKLDTRTLIEHQIDVIQSLGITDICVVIGYGEQQVRAVLKDRVHYVYNDQALTTNSLYSLWLAREWVTGPFVQLNSDVLADAGIYERLITCAGSAIVFDSGSGKSDEHMKVSLRGQRLVQISKTLPNDRSQGESLGLLKFDEAGSAMLFKAASQLVGEGFTNQWAPAAVDRIAPHHPIRALDVSGLPWTEIDYIEDALFAKYEILPAVLPSWRRARRPAQIGRIRNFARQFFATVTSVGSVLHDLF